MVGLIVYYLLQYPISLDAKVSVKLAVVKKNSPISLVELWDTPGRLTFANWDYYRNEMLDEWDTKTPFETIFELKDDFGKRLAVYRFNTSESSISLSSWMTKDRIKSWKPYSFGNFVTTIRNDTLWITASDLDNQVYLVTGRFIGSEHNQFIGYTKNGSLFSFHDGQNNLTEGQTIIWTEHYINETGVTTYNINLGALEGTYFINGLSILNEVNQSVTYTISYSTYNNAGCDPTYIKDITGVFTFYCNGSMNSIPTLRIECLWIYMSSPVHDIHVALTESDKGFIIPSRININGNYADDLFTTTTMFATKQTTTPCTCQCGNNEKSNKYDHLANKTLEELEILLKSETDQIKKELTIDKSSLSSYTRSKTSASDKRSSATGIGTLGFIVLVLEIGFTLVSDMSRFYVMVNCYYRRIKSILYNRDAIVQP